MTADDAIAWTLARLNTAFIHHYDRREYDKVLAMFTPDAVYEVRSRKLHGHADIKAALDARAGPELTVRHLVTNLHFHIIEDGYAHGVCCLTAYAGPTPADTGPARYPAANAGHIHQLTDRYALHDGRWKIAHRIAEELLTPATGWHVPDTPAPPSPDTPFPSMLSRKDCRVESHRPYPAGLPASAPSRMPSWVRAGS
jgi:ketosteroid isomerase-like protein